MSFTPTEIQDWQKLLPKWQAYKRTAAWVMTPEDMRIIQRLAWEKLNRKIEGGCGSCFAQAMRELENIAGTQ